MNDDDLIYWNGIAVGCQEGKHIVWFSNAPREAIEAYTMSLSNATYT